MESELQQTKDEIEEIKCFIIRESDRQYKTIKSITTTMKRIVDAMDRIDARLRILENEEK